MEMVVMEENQGMMVEVMEMMVSINTNNDGDSIQSGHSYIKISTTDFVYKEGLETQF